MRESYLSRGPNDKYKITFLMHHLSNLFHVLHVLAEPDNAWPEQTTAFPALWQVFYINMRIRLALLEVCFRSREACTYRAVKVELGEVTLSAFHAEEVAVHLDGVGRLRCIRW